MTAASLDHELDAVIEEHRDAWLREAEATLTRLDQWGLVAGTTLHVIDFRTLGAPAKGYFGFAAGAELHELARDFLPADASPAIAVAVNVDRIARTRPPGATETIGAAITAVAIHELAHVLDDEARGYRLPAGATLEQVLRSLTDGRATAAAHRSQSHGPGWARAFLHLVIRASRLSRRREWVEGFVRDTSAVLTHEPGTYFDALAPELLATRADARLVDVLRTPAPAGFLSLFTPHPSGTTPGKES